MRIPGLLSSSKDISIGVIGFLFAFLILDSGGLAQWADRLGVGPLRTVAVPATRMLDAYLHPFGFDALRAAMLAGLAEAGWSDDIVAEAASHAPVAPLQTSCATLPLPHPVPNPALDKPVHAGPPLKQAVNPIPPQTLMTPPQSPPTRPAQKPIADAYPAVTKLPALLPVPAGRPRVVALVGDSMMAVGLSSMLLRETANDADLKILKAFRSGTGLARPDVFDWMKGYPALMKDTHPDLDIVSMGANDTQSYVYSDGTVLKFGSDAWIASYRDRVSAFMDMLEASARQIVWVGLPPMKSALYDSHIAEINRITYTVVSAYPNAIWWNPAPLIGDRDGQFRDIGMVAGRNGHMRIAQLREPDGIHLSDDGASLLTDVMIPWLEGLPANPVPKKPSTH